jgi:sodium-dependent dicarboxylate transporter 2/3/5
MLFSAPLALVLLIALYFVLTRWLWPNNIKGNTATMEFIHNERVKLGPVSTAERRVLVVFMVTALLWITRGFLVKTGWFQVDDNMIAIAAGIALFIIPSGLRGTGVTPGTLLNWSDTSRMAWGTLLLFGGGIALAESLEKTGVMEIIGQNLALLGQTGPFILVLTVVIVSIFLSELMSNVAQVIVLSPVLCALADTLHLNPLFLGIPMTLAASAASMLPMGTPPNAIVFGSGIIRMKDMVKAGLIMNLISILIITLFTWLILPWIMHFSV